MTNRTNSVSPIRTIRRVMRLAHKELRETLRDRRTVVTLVLMPLLVYPLLSISFQKLLVSNMQSTSGPVFLIGTESERELDLLAAYLAEGERLLDQQRVATPGESAAGDLAEKGSADSSPDIEGRWFPDTSLEEHVTNLDVQIGVRILGNKSVSGAADHVVPVRIDLIYRDNSPTSQQTLAFVESRLQAVNRIALQKRLTQAGLATDAPITIGRTPLKSMGSVPISASTLVPLVLILMTITGAVYPAIDLTAGERERGTMEMLIAAPIPRVALLMSKYIAVLTVAVLTAMVNLLAMTVTILSSGLSSLLLPNGLSPFVMAQVLGLMILFAAFFSAVLLALTSFARSFKEAQAYLIPVMLLAISPGLLSLMPGLELTGLLAVAPLVNIVLLARDLLEGTASPALAALAIVSTVGYAVMAIMIAARIFGNDALLYASHGSWADLYRRPPRTSLVPSTATGIACLAVMFPIYFVLGNIASSIGRHMTDRLVLNGLVTGIVFGGCPLLLVFYQRVRIKSGFRIQIPTWLASIGAVLLGLALWPWAHLLFVFGQWIGLATLDRQQFSQAEQLLRGFHAQSLLMLLFALAVVPAVFEEWFFRGFLFSSLSKRFRGLGTVVISAVLFAAFHILTPSVLTPERFLPSLFLGLVLGWVCLRTGSVVPGMMLHSIHNGLLIALMQNSRLLTAFGWSADSGASLPGIWLVVSAGLALCGALLVWFGTMPRQPNSGLE